MAVKNLQTLALCVANNHGVRVTGTECNGSMQAHGKSQAHFLSLLWLPLPGPYPIRTGPDAEIAEDKNPATAEAVLRTGRSASWAGVLPSTRLARSFRQTVLSTQPQSSATARFWLFDGDRSGRSAKRITGVIQMVRG